MTSSSLVELLRRTEERLRNDRRIDIGLADIRDCIDESDGIASGTLSELKLQLLERSKAVVKAQEDLKQLVAAVQELEPVLHLTGLGWRARRPQLTSALAADPAEGVRSWLGDWFDAATTGRHDALDRLRELELPAGLGLLAKRARVAADGLKDHSWHLVEPVLSGGEVGLSIKSRTVPEDSVRHDLTRTLARLAVSSAPQEEVARRLERLRQVGPDVLCVALAARAARRFGDHEEAAAHATRAHAQSPTDLDVAIEWAENVRRTDTETAAIDAARAAVDALHTLVDIDAALAGLLTKVPAEIWIAVAERAAHEGEEAIAGKALSAADVAAEQNVELRATVAELRIAATPMEPHDGYVEALLAAAGLRHAAGQFRVSQGHFRRAYELQPENFEAGLGLANCLTVLSSSEPPAEGREGLREAIAIVHRFRERRPLGDTHPWGYAVEAEAHLALSDTMAEHQGVELWRALEAATRAAAREPTTWQRWQLIAECATALDLFWCALAFAERAAETGRAHGGPAAGDARVQALANVGRFDEALALLPTEPQPWHEAVRGYVLAMKGQRDAALGVLDRTDLDPRWTWARDTRLLLRVLEGQTAAAARDAAAILADVGVPFEDTTDPVPVANALLVLGRVDEALDFIRTNERTLRSPDFSLPAALLLAGRGHESIQRLMENLPNASYGDLAAWKKLQQPVIEHLAAELGQELPQFGSLDAAIAVRVGELEITRDPVAEMESAPPGPAELGLTTTARAAAAALLALCRGDLKGTLKRLADEPSLRDDHDFQELAKYVEGEQQAAATQALVPKVLHELNDLRAEQPGPALLRLLDIEPWTAAQAISEVGGSAAEDAVRWGLERLRADPAVAPRTDLLAVLRSLAPTDFEMQGIVLELPPSWFAGYEEPVSDHPLFLRHLPEIRATSETEIPGVQVRVDETLEPDGYRISGPTFDVAEGRAAPDRRWADPDALVWLPAALRDLASDDPGRALVSMSAEAVERAGPLAALLTLSAQEIVTRAVAEVAATRAHAALGAPLK